MGDRVSVSFVNGDEESVALFSHWGGLDFVGEARAYVAALKLERSGSTMPLDRLEPGVVMVDFIRHVTKGESRVVKNLYLGATQEDGDNSDNGHHKINLARPASKQDPTRYAKHVKHGAGWKDGAWKP